MYQYLTLILPPVNGIHALCSRRKIETADDMMIVCGKRHERLGVFAQSSYRAHQLVNANRLIFPPSTIALPMPHVYASPL
jgi:hypothetical protein